MWCIKCEDYWYPHAITLIGKNPKISIWRSTWDLWVDSVLSTLHKYTLWESMALSTNISTDTETQRQIPCVTCWLLEGFLRSTGCSGCVVLHHTKENVSLSQTSPQLFQHPRILCTYHLQSLFASVEVLASLLGAHWNTLELKYRLSSHSTNLTWSVLNTECA